MYRKIPVYNKDGIVTYTLVDKQDFLWISKLRFNLDHKGYCCTTTEHELLHRMILGLTKGDGLVGDHINRNRLDNRRSNLRVIPQFMDSQNRTPKEGCTSKYRGVNWCMKNKRWQVRTQVDGKRYFLGLYDDEDEAGKVAREFRLKHMLYATD